MPGSTVSTMRGSRCRRAPQAGSSTGPHPAGWCVERQEGGTQEGGAPGQGHHLKGRQMKRASAAGRPPGLCRHLPTRGAWPRPLGSP